MTGNNNDTGAPIDEKSNQWFGATVSSSGENGVVVVSFVQIINSPPQKFNPFSISRLIAPVTCSNKLAPFFIPNKGSLSTIFQAL